jgi:ribonuclease HI
MAKKAYVVWEGKKPGVYHTWSETKAQTDGFPGAKFKGFDSLEAANAAFGGGKFSSGSKSKFSAPGKNPVLGSRPTGTYLTVDAAYSHSTLICEWRGVLVTGDRQTEVFRSAQYQGGSANVGEFLGIIQGLQYLREQGLAMPLYSDSYNAQVWVKRKAHKSSAKRSAELTKLLDEGIRYLTETPNKGPGVYVNIVDWKTSEWGEIPADFGRK